MVVRCCMRLGSARFSALTLMQIDWPWLKNLEEFPYKQVKQQVAFT